MSAAEFTQLYTGTVLHCGVAELRIYWALKLTSLIRRVLTTGAGERTNYLSSNAGTLIQKKSH